jgi:hypothetical protein
MHRTRWLGMAASLLTLLTSFAVGSQPRPLSTDELKAIRGGDWYCAVPSIVRQNCKSCHPVQRPDGSPPGCPVEQPDGTFKNTAVFFQCNVQQYDTLCYVTPMTGMQTPVCQSNGRGINCGEGVTYYLYDCSPTDGVVIPATDPAVCNTYTCAIWTYDLSSATSYSPATGVNCQNVTQGNY